MTKKDELLRLFVRRDILRNELQGIERSIALVFQDSEVQALFADANPSPPSPESAAVAGDTKEENKHE